MCIYKTPNLIFIIPPAPHTLLMICERNLVKKRMKRKGGSKNYNLGTYVVGLLFPSEKQHIFWKKK